LSDVKYFEQKLYKSLNVPISRLESSTGFTLGRTSEITRDELKFNKFIERVRSKFTVLFDELMKRQLALKGICSIDEWEVLKEKIHYDFLKDNNFSELKESELMTARLQLMNLVDPYVGTYFSRAWVKKHVLHFDEEGIERMDNELEEEKAAADAMGLGSLSVSAQNAAVAQNAAMAAMQGNKVTDALEVKKVEIASSLITPEVETNEVETDQVEVDGSIEGSDGSADVASAEETSATS